LTFGVTLCFKWGSIFSFLCSVLYIIVLFLLESLVWIYHCLFSFGHCIACPLINTFETSICSLFYLPGLRFFYFSIYKIFHVSSICFVYRDYSFCTVSSNDILPLYFFTRIISCTVFSICQCSPKNAYITLLTWNWIAQIGMKYP
jgi:hypothetical protein